MKVQGATLREIRLRLRERFEISSGARQERRILLLTLEADGLRGWSECVAAEDPSYSAETTETAWHILTEFVLPAVVGHDFEEPGEVLDPVAWIRGNRMARAAVEMAAWDLDARRQGVSLARRLGGEVDEVRVGVSIGIQPDDDELLRQIEAYLARGYSKIKIKIKPGRDVAMLRKVRDRFGAGAPLMADANSAYTLDDLPRLREMDDLGLMMIEQPLAYDDLRDHARLQEEPGAPRARVVRGDAGIGDRPGPQPGPGDPPGLHPPRGHIREPALLGGGRGGARVPPRGGTSAGSRGAGDRRGAPGGADRRPHGAPGRVRRVDPRRRAVGPTAGEQAGAGARMGRRGGRHGSGPLDFPERAPERWK